MATMLSAFIKTFNRLVVAHVLAILPTAFIEFLYAKLKMGFTHAHALKHLEPTKNGMDILSNMVGSPNISWVFLLKSYSNSSHFIVLRLNIQIISILKCISSVAHNYSIRLLMNKDVKCSIHI